MKKGWVDFKHIKASVTFEQVLAHYGIQLKPAKGDELLGLCPFHEDTKPSFRVNTKKRVFHCFGCDAKGNVLDFVARKEGVSIKKAALLVGEWFSIAPTENAAPTASYGPEKERKEPQQAKEDTTARKRGSSESASEAYNEATGPEPFVNKPLTFTLKLEYDHPYLRGRGISPELAQVFGIGFCSRGLMKNRIAIPIYDADGQLVAYAGRWVGEDPPEGTGKYMLPPQFEKSSVLYNLNRVKGSDSLVVVEGFFSVFRLHQLGIPSVALIGRTMSGAQVQLLLKHRVKRLTLLLDADDPGREAQAKLLLDLAGKFYVRDGNLPEGTQPDTVDENLLREALS